MLNFDDYESVCRLKTMTNVSPENFFKTFSYLYDSECPSWEKITILQIGAGGTGGAVVPQLARFLYSLNKRNFNSEITYTIIDGDNVEAKNLLRQNFLEKDLGKNKAEALSERYSRAFGVPINYSPVFFTDHFPHSDSYDSNELTIIIGCVDSNNARRSIHNYMERAMRSTMRRMWKRQSVIWIDSGNERFSGQVFAGGILPSLDQKNISSELKDYEMFYLPMITDIYPEILDETKDSKSEISCAERMLVDEQNLFVNNMAAMNVMNFIRQFILRERTSINGVIFGIYGKTDCYYLTTTDPNIGISDSPIWT